MILLDIALRGLNGYLVRVDNSLLVGEGATIDGARVSTHAQASLAEGAWTSEWLYTRGTLTIYLMIIVDIARV